VAFVVFLVAAGATLALARRAPGGGVVVSLAGLLLYMSVACTFLPLPTAWIVLGAARGVDPWAVAVVASVGTCIANLHDYYIVNALCRLGRLRRARHSSLHRDAARWFRRTPFATLAVASFLPIPIDPVRWLAVSTDYPRYRYALATLAGRLPRYLLLAVIGWRLQPSNRVLVAVLAAAVVLGIARASLEARRRGHRTEEAIRE
jgi:membrane protein YqaA with SNARE-associated domain